MSPFQKQDFMATVIDALFDQSRLTESEANEAKAYFKVNGSRRVTNGVTKVLNAIDTGVVQFAVQGEAIAIYFPHNIHKLMTLLGNLTPLQQFDRMNDIVKELKDKGHINAEEADEAFADILKVFIYRRYNNHSRGTKKVIKSLHKVIDNYDDDYDDEEAFDPEDYEDKYNRDEDDF
jgi:polyhydroxyalkanoate synthesis regulator phasin